MCQTNDADKPRAEEEEEEERGGKEERENVTITQSLLLIGVWAQARSMLHVLLLLLVFDADTDTHRSDRVRSSWRMMMFHCSGIVASEKVSDKFDAFTSAQVFSIRNSASHLAESAEFVGGGPSPAAMSGVAFQGQEIDRFFCR